MCAATLALTLLVGTCEPISIASIRLSAPVSHIVSAPRRLRDPELDRIRGGYGYIARVGSNGIIRIVQDGNTREMTLPLAAGTQVTDTWWSDIGSAYIAASLSRP